MALFTGTFPALLATILTAAWIPNRVRQHFYPFLRRTRVIALDNQLTASRAPFRGFVPDHHVEARSRV